MRCPAPAYEPRQDTRERSRNKNSDYALSKKQWLFLISSLSGSVSASESYATWKKASAVQVPGLLLCSFLPNLKSGVPATALRRRACPIPSNEAMHLGPIDLSSSTQELCVIVPEESNLVATQIKSANPRLEKIYTCLQYLGR